MLALSLSLLQLRPLRSQFLIEKDVILLLESVGMHGCLRVISPCSCDVSYSVLTLALSLRGMIILTCLVNLDSKLVLTLWSPLV